MQIRSPILGLRFKIEIGYVYIIILCIFDKAKNIKDMKTLTITYRDQKQDLNKSLFPKLPITPGYVVGFSYNDGLTLVPFKDIRLIEDQGSDKREHFWVDEDGNTIFEVSTESGKIVRHLFNMFHVVGDLQAFMDEKVEAGLLTTVINQYGPTQ